MKPVAYIYPSDLARIASHPMTCTAYPDQVRCAEESTIPLFTLKQVREYAEARAAAQELTDMEILHEWDLLAFAPSELDDRNVISFARAILAAKEQA